MTIRAEAGTVAEALEAAGLSSNEWEAPRWFSLAYAASPAGRILDGVRAVAASGDVQDALEPAFKIGGWRAVEDLVLSLLDADAERATP